MSPTRQSITRAKRERVFRRDGYMCVDCGTPWDLTIGHIKPLSRGGTNAMTNLQTECWSCNQARGNRDGTVVEERAGVGE